MKRTDVVDLLDMASPALAKSGLIPILSHLCFTGTHAMAYNDHIGISVPFKTEFTGAVPGDVLLNLLRNSKAKDVDFTANETELLIKAASSRLKLPLLPDSSFVFEMPDPKSPPPKGLSKESQTLPVKVEDFISAVDECLLSVGNDASVPDQLGVTIIPDGTELAICATNNATMTYSRVALSGKCNLKDRATISTEFCKQLLKLSKDDPKIKVEVHDDHSLATTSAGVRLFGKLIEIEKPLDFLGVLKHHVTDDVIKTAVPIPSKLRLMLERAVIVTMSSATEQTRTTISIQGGKMRFVTKSALGEVVDTVLLGEGHPDTTLDIECKWLKAGYGGFDKMLMTERCFIMFNKYTTYLVACSA